MKFCVIGVGTFGYQVSTILAENNIEVLVVDKNRLKIESIRDRVAQAICIDIIDESSLRTIDIENMDAVIVTLGKNFHDAVIITRLLKKRLNISTVIVRTSGQTEKEILELAGADQVIMPELESAIKLADSLSANIPNITRITGNLSVSQIKAPKKFIGKKLEILKLMDNYEINCIAIQRDEEIIIVGPTEIIEENDILFLAGKKQNLEKISEV